MLPALQPHRPKVPQQHPRPDHINQQKRFVEQQQPPRPPIFPQAFRSNPEAVSEKPRNQLEAMPPFAAAAPAAFFPSRMAGHQPGVLYDSSIRHPVFFTEQLRRPPFPLPEMACQGWSPVAHGYVEEQRRIVVDQTPRTKL